MMQVSVKYEYKNFVFNNQVYSVINSLSFKVNYSGKLRIGFEISVINFI